MIVLWVIGTVNDRHREFIYSSCLLFCFWRIARSSHVQFQYWYLDLVTLPLRLVQGEQLNQARLKTGLIKINKKRYFTYWFVILQRLMEHLGYWQSVEWRLNSLYKTWVKTQLYRTYSHQRLVLDFDFS